jgi:hypothetical protein
VKRNEKGKKSERERKTALTSLTKKGKSFKELEHNDSGMKKTDKVSGREEGEKEVKMRKEESVTIKEK